MRPNWSHSRALGGGVAVYVKDRFEVTVLLSESEVKKNMNY